MIGLVRNQLQATPDVASISYGGNVGPMIGMAFDALPRHREWSEETKRAASMLNAAREDLTLAPNAVVFHASDGRVLAERTL